MKIELLFFICAYFAEIALADYTSVNIPNEGDTYLIESKNYPDDVHSKTKQIFSIKTAVNNKILISCKEIDLKSRIPCTDDDMLYVFHGNSLDELCGKKTGYRAESVGNKMSVRITIARKGKVSCELKAVPRGDDLDIEGILNAPSEEQDTREHGVLSGVKKTSCPCGWANKAENRIVGGRETMVNEFPFVVGLINRYTKFLFCGAAIITPYHALTASHCTQPKKDTPLAILIGEHDQRTESETNVTEIVNVAYTIEHELYNKIGYQNDIALLVLERKIIFSQQVGPACLPSGKIDLINQYVKVLGWGRLATEGPSSSVLRKVNIRVVPIEVCAAKYIMYIHTTNPRQICTFRKMKDSCQGDSGGPLVWRDPETNRFTLVALVSFGKECGSETPAVNTDVSYYMDWITQHIEKSNPEGHTCAKIN